MSNIVIKQFNRSSYSLLIPSESINSDTVDNLHASQIVSSSYNNSVEYTNYMIRKLYNGTTTTLTGTVSDITMADYYNGQIGLWKNGHGYTITFDLSSLGTAALIGTSAASINDDVSSTSSTKRYPLGKVTLTVGSATYSYEVTSTSFINFGMDEIRLVNIFNRCLYAKDSQLKIKYEITDDSYSGSKYTYCSFKNYQSPSSFSISGNYGYILK